MGWNAIIPRLLMQSFAHATSWYPTRQVCDVRYVKGGVFFLVDGHFRGGWHFEFRPTQGGNQAWKERVSIRQLKEDSTVSDEKSDSSHLAPNLCYACNTTLSSRSNRRSGKTTVNGADNRHVLLPSWVDSNLKSCLSRPKMEEQIRGFLLEKDSPGAEMN